MNLACAHPRLALSALLSVLFSAGCAASTHVAGPKADGYEDCTAGGAATFAVAVYDSVTMTPAALGAVLFWNAGQSSGTTIAYPPTPPYSTDPPLLIQGPFGRPGTYEITIRKDGYQDWRDSSLVVQEGTAGHCSVLAAVSLTARLNRR